MPKKIDFDTLTVSRPNFYLYDRILYSTAGCGASALSLLTGGKPHNINKLNKDKYHFSNSFMENYLRKRKFQLFKITDNRLLKKKDNPLEEKIKDNHVLLCCMKLSKKSYSWAVIWGQPSFMIHNFEIIKMKTLDFANYPMDSLYIVYKKSWK
jgi:hypothetical protein